MHGVLEFWGKARPPEASAHRWHPAAYHMLDVAAAAMTLLNARPAWRRTLAGLLDLAPDAVVDLGAFLAGLHDIGKFARSFQAQVPELWPRALGPFVDPGRSPHGDDASQLWQERIGTGIAERLGWEFYAISPLAHAAFGHHGWPTRLSPTRSAQFNFGAGGLAAADEHVARLLALLGSLPARPAAGGSRAARASWWIAGIMTVADWVGSNPEWFPYEAPVHTYQEYWTLARARAEVAIRQSGLVPGRPATRRPLRELLPSLAPTPAQRWADTVELPEGPVLVVLEDATGSGKTEAANILAHRLLAAGRAEGAYWAMPTQATANAMYERQAGFVGKLFDPSFPPSLVLAHSQAALHDRFRASLLQSSGAVEGGDASQEDAPGSVTCAAYLADDRRKALLADVGAGTVDQALLGVLPARFGTVRLSGLAGKVLILDEAHAYDRYMGVEAEHLLRFHAASGGHAIVLSATLPCRRREELVRSWLEGTDPGRFRPAGLFSAPPPASVTSSLFPLATVVAGACDAVEYELDASDRSIRAVGVRLVHDVDEVVEALAAAVRGGGAVAWIRNTVRDCIAAADLVQEAGIQPIVFHARFAQGDRQAREAEVLRLFGPRSATSDRAGRLVLATQVIEQSLDLDFDVLCSDLAPMDLLIQRAGRLWRHPHRDGERPAGTARELLLHSPPPVDDPPPDWLAGAFAGTRRVYRQAAILWKTARLLASEGAIRTPDNLRSLVERAYEPDGWPSGLVEAAVRSLGEDAADEAMATYAVVRLEDGYFGSRAGWDTDLRVQTRLGDAQTPLRLGRVLPDGVTPWVRDDDPARAWALSEVRIRSALVPMTARAQGDDEVQLQPVRASMGRFERDLPIAPLRQVGAAEWRANLICEDDTVLELTYDLRAGLRVDRRRGVNRRPTRESP